MYVGVAVVVTKQKLMLAKYLGGFNCPLIVFGAKPDWSPYFDTEFLKRFSAKPLKMPKLDAKYSLAGILFDVEEGRNHADPRDFAFPIKIVGQFEKTPLKISGLVSL